MARTPKGGKKGGPGSKRADGGRKLRRKAAMQGDGLDCLEIILTPPLPSRYYLKEDEEISYGIGWG